MRIYKTFQVGRIPISSFGMMNTQNNLQMTRKHFFHNSISNLNENVTTNTNTENANTTANNNVDENTGANENVKKVESLEEAQKLIETYTKEINEMKPKIEQVEKLQKLKAELEKEVLYQRAERENQVKIGKRDVDNAKMFGIQGFAKDLLGVADNISLCLNNVSKESLESNNELKDLFTGVDLTKRELEKVFLQYKIAEYDPLEDDFDPNLHNALFEMPTPEESKENTVGQVIKTGYKFHSRVLRAAEVGVCRFKQ